VKTTLTLVLATFGIVGIALASPVVAQETLPYAPSAVTQQTPNQPNNAALPAGNGQPEATPPSPQVSDAATAGGAISNLATTPSSVIDNNLWPGAAQIPGCAICGGGNCTPADWYIDQDVRIIARSRPRDAVIGYDFTATSLLTAGGTLTEVVNTRSATPGISGAWGMAIGHYFARDTNNNDHFLEFSFWGLNNWTDDAAVYGHRVTESDNGGTTTTGGSLYSQYVNAVNGLSLAGFNAADTYTVYYSSATNNFELNGRISPRGRPDREVFLPNGQVRRECQPGAYMSYLYGLRFFQLDETFRFHSESSIQTSQDGTGTLLTSNEYTGDYDVVTHNNLLGLQAGAELTFRECRWAWGFRAKAGPYVNFADQESDIHADEVGGGDYLRRVADSRHGAAFIGEAGVEASYKFRPTLVGRVSYDAMWVSGVAIAPEQLQFAVEPSNRINTNGLAFFQGLTLGLEWQW
jgi:hypothetical protein